MADQELDTLYCEEDEQWEEDEECIIIDFFSEEDDDEELSSLFSKETEQNELQNENNSSLVNARTEAVDWILRVVSHYSFSAQTALLAVNYLDEFLFGLRHHSQTQNPWKSQLAAVACLSLAAKVEEIQVPLLLDFQVEGSKYVFEARTIQRMELLILSNRQWKMNSVTPFSFLDYFARKIGLKNNQLCFEFFKRCEIVLLSIIPDWRFKSYLPSVIASATMLHVISTLQPSIISGDSLAQLLTILGINKDKMEECWTLIKEVESRKQIDSIYKRKFRMMKMMTMVVEGSPKGVIDVSFSSSSSSLSLEGSNDSSSLSSSPEPLSKRTRNNSGLQSR